MEPIFRRCAGLDVHQKTVAVCRRVLDDQGRLDQQVRTFGTMTQDLLDLADWLAEVEVTHVAMESTGVFWKPIWNVLEERFTLLLVNARQIKQVPGRKTDVKDCEWIAQLLQHGLLRGSFVPPTPVRQMRDLTRHRTKLTERRTSIANRIHKVLEDANIKLGAVASDILGVSGRQMLEALIRGEENSHRLADLAQRRLRSKIPQLEQAMTGRITDHHRFLLKTLFEELRYVEGQIEQLNARIGDHSRPFEQELALLDTIPGINRCCAETILAETGADMNQFPSAAHLASWAGICPGNNESAGKRRSGKTPKGDRWLRAALGEAAWAAARTKGTYLSAQYRRLAARRGKKRAIVAVGHTILVAAYHILKNRTPYHELGHDYYERRGADRLTRRLVQRLENLGHKVTLEPAEEAA